MQCVTRPRITELNPHLLCVLCGGYYIDATAIIECLHSFCKSCIVRYLETHKYCPICDVLVHKTHPLQNIRSDKILQSIVYKLVPNLYEKEMCNRRKFYAPVHSNLRPPDPEARGEITESSKFFSFSDTINLSLEYINYLGDQNYFFVASSSKRYFRCQADVSVKHLRKLIAVKYALATKHEIRLFYNGIQLPEHLTLLDIAYISSWKRRDFIRLLYQILEVRKTVVPLEKEKIAPPAELTQLESSKISQPSAPVTVSSDSASEIPQQTKEVPNLVPSLKTETVSQNSTQVELPQPTSNNKVEILNGTSSTVTVTSNITTVNITTVSSISTPIVTAACKPTVNGTSATKDPAELEINTPKVVVNGLIAPEVEVDKLASSCSQSTDPVKLPVATKTTEGSTELAILKRPFDSVANKVETSTSSAVDVKKSTDCPVPVKVPKLSSNEPGELPKNTTLKALPKTTTMTLNYFDTSRSTNTVVSNVYPLTYSVASKYNSVRTSASPVIPRSEQIQKVNPRPIFRRSEPHSGSETNTKIVKAFTRPWSSPSVSASPTPAATTSVPSIQIKEKPKAMKMINARNTPRYLGNPASGIRPMYQVPAQAVPTSKSSKNDDVKKPMKNVSVMKIDPQTLSPIIASSSSVSISTSPSVSKKPFSYLPSTSELYTNANLFSNSLPAHTTSGLSSKPISSYLTPPGLAPSALHPLMYEMYGNRPRTLEYMKAMSDFCNNPSFFHPSLPAPINTLYTSLHSPAKYEKSHSKMSAKSPPAVQRIPPTNNNTKIPVSEHSTERKVVSSRKHDTVSNGQIKSKGKKPSEVSNFSINNLIPLEAMTYMSHSCSADGVNQICDQLPPEPSIKTGASESKTNEKTSSKEIVEDKNDK